MIKIWANSGDSHLVEPDDLFATSLPPDLAARMPRSEKDADGRWETVHVDGQEFRRRMPRPRGLVDPETGETVDERAPNANDPHRRLLDLDGEGIWGELIYPSIGVWTSSINDPGLLREGMRAINDWAVGYQQVSPRYVCTASIPLLRPDDAVAEIERAARLGFKAAFFPVAPPAGVDDWHTPVWDPVYAALETNGVLLSFHIGTEPHDATTMHGGYYRGPGGALLNYVETTYGGQRAVTKLIAGGVFDRFPDLRVIVSEGGATWGPFLADRLDEDTASTHPPSDPCCASSPASTSTPTCTHPSSTTAARLPRSARWAGGTCCGEATTPTSKAPTATRRRRCTSSSMTSTTPRVAG